MSRYFMITGDDGRRHVVVAADVDQAKGIVLNADAGDGMDTGVEIVDAYEMNADAYDDIGILIEDPVSFDDDGEEVEE